MHLTARRPGPGFEPVLAVVDTNDDGLSSIAVRIARGVGLVKAKNEELRIENGE
jgi:hypothetical protein